MTETIKETTFLTNFILPELPKTEQEIVKLILNQNLTYSCLDAISAVIAYKKNRSPEIYDENLSAEKFLISFWDYENSDYIKEKKFIGQTIHKRHTENSLQRINKYWIPEFSGKKIRDITKDDINKVTKQLVEKKELSFATINQIIKSIVCPLKWAYKKGFIIDDITKGIVYLRNTTKKRDIVTMKEAKKIFRSKWNDEFSRIANLTAACTGLRLGEIQALQICDVEKKQIHVRHSWERLEGLKMPKNNNERTVPIPPSLYRVLRRMIRDNPFGQDGTNFLFWGESRNAPSSTWKWTEGLHICLRRLGIIGNIVFHSWRHFYATNMANIIDQRKLQLATGHGSMKNIFNASESEEPE